MENNSESTCYNCKYFVQHYIKNNFKFCKIACGHCINGCITKREKMKNFKNADICTFWVEKEISDKNEEIESIIMETAKRLNMIAKFLKSE